MPFIFHPLPSSSTSTTAAAAAAFVRFNMQQVDEENTVGRKYVVTCVGRVPEEEVSVPALLLLLRSNRQAVSCQSPPLRTHQTACYSAVQVQAVNCAAAAAAVWGTAGASRFAGC